MNNEENDVTTILFVCCLCSGGGDMEARSALAIAFATPKKVAPTCGKSSCKCGCEDGEICRCAQPAPAPVVSPCSSACMCGCNEGLPCRCGDAVSYAPTYTPTYAAPAAHQAPDSVYAAPAPSYVAPVSRAAPVQVYVRPQTQTYQQPVYAAPAPATLPVRQGRNSGGC